MEIRVADLIDNLLGVGEFLPYRWNRSPPTTTSSRRRSSTTHPGAYSSFASLGPIRLPAQLCTDTGESLTSHSCATRSGSTACLTQGIDRDVQPAYVGQEVLTSEGDGNLNTVSLTPSGPVLGAVVRSSLARGGQHLAYAEYLDPQQGSVVGEVDGAVEP